MQANQSKDRKSILFGLILALLIIILVTSLISFFYFTNSGSNNKSQGVNFWLYHNPEQVSGQENTFFIFIKNKEIRDLKDVEVILNFPQGFVPNSIIPECSNVLSQGCIWLFDSIKKDELKEIKLQGTVFGQADKDHFFTGRLNFGLEGFSSEFQKNLSSSVRLNSPLKMTWEMLEQGSFSESIESTIYLENTTDEIIKIAQVIIDLPEDFVLDPSVDEHVKLDKEENRLIWAIKDLDAGNKEELKFSGYLNNPRIEQVSFIANAGLSNNNEDFFVQTTQEKMVSMAAFDLIISLQTNNVIDPPLGTINDREIFNGDNMNLINAKRGVIEPIQSYDWGDVIPINLIYFNNSDKIIEDFSLTLELKGETYLDSDSSYQDLWEYKKILPGDNEKVSINLYLKSALEAAKNNYFQSRIILKIFAKGRFPNKTKEWEIYSNSIELRIKTDLKFDAVARYYDDERANIGSGALPPKVGQETDYWIFWRIKNTTNSIENILVKTKLPEQVDWVGTTKTTHGLVLYNEVNREVTWQFPKLPRYSGGPYSLVEAGFELSIIPDISQVDLILPLTKDIYMSAEDQFTGYKFSKQIDYLDTNLIGDPVAEGLGRVIDD